MSRNHEEKILTLSEEEIDEQLSMLETKIKELKESKLELETDLDKGVTTLETIVKMEVFNDYINTKRKTQKP